MGSNESKKQRTKIRIGGESQNEEHDTDHEL